MSLKTSRRHFLKRSLQGLALTGVADLISSSFFNSLVSKAFASTMEPNPSGYYFGLIFAGGPPRWMFDLPLTPEGKTAGNFVQGNFGTGFEKVGQSLNLTYNPVKKSVGGKTLWLPPVWNYHTPGQNFDDVLKNMLFVRGMDMEINSHGLGQVRVLSPTLGGVSINGAVADKSDRALSSVSDSSSATFKSSKGLSSNIISTISNTNLAQTLLTPFKPLPKGRLHLAVQNLALQDQVFEKIEEELKKIGVSQNSLSDSYDKAMTLIDSNILSLANGYLPLKAKYEGLIQAALNPSKASLDGLNSIIIKPNLSDPRFNPTNSVPITQVKLNDLRDMTDSSTIVPGMAQSFALMELLTDKLTTSFAMTMRHPQNVLLGQGRRVSISHDQHNTGSVFSTYITTLYYRSVLSCLTEFTRVLKDKNIFDKSMIHMSSEFNRNPRVNGSGSDHGVNGGCSSLISGAFPNPEVIGNLTKDDARKQGTWGNAANYDLAGSNEPIRVNDVARTITSVLGVQDIVTNGRALLKPQGNHWVPKKKEAKNV